ncbi:MAG: phosphoglycerate dehydrogenase [Gammaproteobacteria bacterium]|nr:MAG: phosphoglycerate dehydrogenase [Gammaproteobacteria bacterium]
MSRLSLSKDRIRFLLLEGIHDSAEAVLREEGYRKVERLRGSLTGEELVEAVRDVHFLGIRSRTQLTAEVIDATRRLNAVGCFCIGTNQVDLAAAEARGIPVFNAPFSNTRSVAELVLAEIIFLLRGVAEKNAAAHRGEWLKTAERSYEIRGKRLGIIGYGHIGTQLGVLAEALGMRVWYHDIENKLPLGNAASAPDLQSLLSGSDVVTLHVPETPQTRNMIGEAELAAMRPGGFLVNASRGTVVDLEALEQALERGHIAGAALDVFPVEPKSNDDEFISPLRRFDNVILTPHVGGSTQEAQENIAIEVAQKLVRYSDNGSTASAVNFPQVALPDNRSYRRIMHIHRNVPGVLEAINHIFSARGVNIAAQYLQTSPRIGYVVMDVETPEASALLEELKGIAGTVRARLLY